MESVRVATGKKFMWDGRIYESAGFETHLGEEEGQLLVYTRRAATQPGAEAQSGANAPHSEGTTWRRSTCARN